MAEIFNPKNWELKQDYIPPCESSNINECSNYREHMDLPPQEADWFDEKGFNWNEYTIQKWELPEDPWFIVLELLKRNWIGAKFIAYLRYNNVIAEIWHMKLNKWDKIILNNWWPNEYELIVWKQIYTFYPIENKIYKISNEN